MDNTLTSRTYPFREPLLLAALAVLAYSVCFFIVIAHKDYWDLVWNSGDNAGYIRVAQGIEACLQGHGERLGVERRDHQFVGTHARH